MGVGVGWGGDIRPWGAPVHKPGYFLLRDGGGLGRDDPPGAILAEPVLGEGRTLEQSSAALLGEETEGFKADSEVGCSSSWPVDLRYPPRGLGEVGFGGHEIQSTMSQTT